MFGRKVSKEARLRLLVGCVGQGQHPCSDESALDDPRLRELLALAALARSRHAAFA